MLDELMFYGLLGLGGFALTVVLVVYGVVRLQESRCCGFLSHVRVLRLNPSECRSDGVQ
jgi:hypothetical protein